MNACETLRLQARYNAWMNARLYAVCAPIPEADRRRDLGAFFRSVHGTLNHILLVDRLWAGRLAGRAPHFEGLDQILHEDFATLRMRQAGADADLQARVEVLRDADLERRVDYLSLMTGDARSLRVGTLLTHLFHHQTHHRGQLTVLLTRLGVDFGETDLIWMEAVH